MWRRSYSWLYTSKLFSGLRQAVLVDERMDDIGAFMAYLLLAATGHGLGSCPIGLIKSYEDDVKDHLNIPESKIFVISIALGKPNARSPINEFRSSGADLSEYVRWVE